MHARTKLLVAFAATITAVVACEDATTPVATLHFSGVLNGANEKPTATTSTATGTALAALHAGGIVGYSVTWNGLTGAVTGAHIHGPADEANTAAVLVTFGALPTGSATQTNSTAANGASAGTLSALDTAHVTPTVTIDSVKKLLKAGLLYVNVHTAANPTGEIRAQLKP